MNKGYLSVYLCLLQFLSSMSCNFQRTFTSLVKFIPKYFIVFDATVNEINFFYFSENLLLVYRNTTDFCMSICSLQLYSVNLLGLTVFCLSL